ncbi:MAG: hypothetical protein U9Q98_10300 [Bacteroidota bacterium]|nr:hypothetical protein [Bacteroidota bacterium]
MIGLPVSKIKKDINTIYNLLDELLGYLDISKEVVQNLIKTEVFTQLDKIIQSSAIVENINSIVRAFLNTSRNRINQEILNLIMFYHNHRRYKAGKRKGKTPRELLTGTKQENDWLEMLMEKMKEHDHLSAA